MKQIILEWIERHREEIEGTYRDLHAIAEVSWKEHETTAFLKREIMQLNLPYRSFETHTGIVAEWTGEAEEDRSRSRVVGLRADIDALWQKAGDDWKANHSCGHDAHMTMVLSALKCLKEIGFQPNRKLIAIFQPAEETGEGARKMLELGVLEEVDALLGIHLRPIQEMPFGKVSPAIYHGATAFVHGKVEGLQAHAARPHLGINVADSMAAIVHAVNGIRSDPTVPASCKVTKINTSSGNANIIPGDAEFSIDLRAQTNETMDRLLEQVWKAVPAAGSFNGAVVELALGSRLVAGTPNPAIESIVGKAIVEIMGGQALSLPPVTPGGEDFHFYPLLKPGLRATMIGLGCDLAPGLHHPDMHFNHVSLLLGTAILSLTAANLFVEPNLS